MPKHIPLHPKHRPDPDHIITELNIELIRFLVEFYAGLRLLTLLRVFPSYLGRGFPTPWACIEGVTQFGLVPPIRSRPVTQIPNPNPLPRIQVHTVCGNYRVSKFEAGWHLWMRQCKPCPAIVRNGSMHAILWAAHSVSSTMCISNPSTIGVYKHTMENKHLLWSYWSDSMWLWCSAQGERDLRVFKDFRKGQKWVARAI